MISDRPENRLSDIGSEQDTGLKRYRIGHFVSYPIILIRPELEDNKGSAGRVWKGEFVMASRG